MVNRIPILFLIITSFLIQPAFAALALNNQDFAYIPPGSFMAGRKAFYEEDKLHIVNITKGFLMYNHEITQKEWFDVMRTSPWVLNPPHANVMVGDNYPAVFIKWTDAQAFISQLNTGLSKLPYSIPTEAQWEYACRAGTDTDFSFGDYDESNPNMSDILNANLWYRENAWNADEPYAHAVKQKQPNPFGLYDMHGNIWEWCYDSPMVYTAATANDPVGPTTQQCKVIRGGAFHVPAFFENFDDCTSANRTCGDQDQAVYNRGFRIVIALTDQLDTDGDGRKDSVDNCPATSNPGQGDWDNDGIGNACDDEGNFNGDNVVGLADAVLAGQVVAGMTPSLQFNVVEDPNQDGQIGLEDIIYILQVLGGLR